MRLLFSTTPLDGHFRPLLPLARALRARGHEIAFATAGSWHEYVVAEGFPALAAGADHATARSVRLDGEQAALAQLQGVDLRHYVFPYLFAEGHAPLKLTELLDVARAWQPDALVHETADLAAPAVAAALGLPSVHHTFGSMLPLATLRRAGDAVAPLWAGIGLDPDPYAGAFRGLYVDVVPPTFNDELPLCPSVRLRPALDGAAAPPAWLAELRRPLVYATMGTVFNTPATFGPLLAALSTSAVGALVTVGRDVDPVELEPVPANVRVERFVPQDHVLPACAAVVTHGGSGTILGALKAGVPMVVLPQGANQFDNAMRCERAGVALTVKPEHATAASIAAALRAVLTDASYREGSRRIQAEIAQMQPVDEVAAAVEEHAARR